MSRQDFEFTTAMIESNGMSIARRPQNHRRQNRNYLWPYISQYLAQILDYSDGNTIPFRYVLVFRNSIVLFVSHEIVFISMSSPEYRYGQLRMSQEVDFDATFDYTTFGDNRR